MTPTSSRTLSVGRLARSFVYAGRGVVSVLRSEPNAWIHTIATAVVVILGLILHLSIAEWCWIVVAIAAVWVAEAFNTAIECVTDLASPTLHPLAARAKDVAAGAVLLTALASALIGLLVLGPRAYVAVSF
jgi:diacylglycerol kinase